ncbi:pantoate--beta-alanine ligase [Cnuella takakiae]|uniref:Pantothenate synthetase n=1 Tax=Cnuella takakiae TaxID=1302690 RepID=A0A1M4VQ27_9BACT|nr:pantoate--beta-alanine ligase [Cnuella takakiae]OLY92534.1 pantoate--beta-alanine ligase [Cnuella takakiae]SHE70960.1 pantoate--beta-alanine ligase [Cnuella takakiae]
MLIFKQAGQLQQYLQQQKASGVRIGFVPTMGALHQGHLSLLRRSLTENTLTVCSIFVNPTQFNNPTDFQHYPITIEQDLQLLLTEGCDVLFLPSVAEVYPEGHIKKQYNLGPLETVLEGAYRPGHFQGVCEVVDRLLEIVDPHVLYMGQKDFQQCMVVRRLLEIRGKATPELRIGDTLREASGLAMSSRNMRLSPADRDSATALYRCLQKVKEALQTVPRAALEQRAQQELEAQDFVVDYVAIRQQHDLQPPVNTGTPLVVLVAATLHGVRLIDNLPLN